MHFALLGDDLAALPLLRALIADPRHVLTQTVLAPRLHAELVKLAPRLRVAASWEGFLADPAVEGVIVLGDADETLRGARQLAAAGKALLVLPAPGQTAAFAYELALVQAETPVTLFPLFPLRVHPLVQQLRESIGTLGEVHHIQLERQLPASRASGSPAMIAEAPLLSSAAITTAFLADADLLRCLAGEYDQVTASRSGDADRGISLATVTLAGGGAPQAVWSATATRADAVWRLTVIGQRGTAILASDLAQSTFTLEVHAPGRDAGAETVSAEAGPRLVEQFAARLRGERVRPDWTDFTRAFELLEAVDRSLRRRRTIDLYFETPSERSVFKTQMTALGCGLMMATLAAVVFYLAAAAMLDLNDTVKQVLRVMIFAPLGLFLLLQLLLFLTKPSPGERGQSEGETNSP